MKNLLKAISVASLATAGVAQAMTGSVGTQNEYTFRGTTLADSNIYSASAETQIAGLTVGIALVDADNGNADYHERNLMAGYSLNLAGVDVDLGYTNYSYGATNPAEEDEISIGISASGVSITYVDGDSNSGAPGAADEDYSVLSFGYSVGGMDFTVGTVSLDAINSDYNYYEISAGTEIAGLDASVTLTNTFSEGTLEYNDTTGLIQVDSGDTPTGTGMDQNDARIVVSLSKALSL